MQDCSGPQSGARSAVPEISKKLRKRGVDHTLVKSNRGSVTRGPGVCGIHWNHPHSAPEWRGAKVLAYEFPRLPLSRPMQTYRGGASPRQRAIV